MRRKFYDVHHATASPIALDALQRIAALFAIESSIQGQTPKRRAAARQDHARQALRNTLSHWTVLGRHTTDGRLEMSNVAERAIRPRVHGRENYLFCRSMPEASAPPASTPLSKPAK